MVAANNMSVGQAFKDCQYTAASHPKLVKKLIKFYLQANFEEFCDEFLHQLKYPLVHGDKQPNVERTLNFVSKFAVTKKSEEDDTKKKNKEKENGEKEGGDGSDEDDEEEADPFLIKLFQFLLNNHEANSQDVRFRVCQMINKLLNNMGEEAVIDDDLYSSIYDTMLHRLQDKVPAVRVQAVLALARLQDPRNKECPVIKAYRYHLTMDPNSDVRRAVLNNIAITFKTLPDILERTRDVRDVVRRQAYLVISQKVHIRSMTIAQRVRLIAEGLKDRTEMVRVAVEKNLLQSWLRMVNGKVLDLLTCLDVEASVKEAELALVTMFKDVPYQTIIDNFEQLNENRLINSDELRPESSLFWRCLAQHLRKEGAEVAVESILPELTTFCKYIEDYALTDVMDEGDIQETAVKNMEKEFVTKQLIGMTMMFDLADDYGRQSLDQLVRTLLTSDKIGGPVVKGLVEVFSKLHPPNSRINQLAEIISDIREYKPQTVAKEVSISMEEQRKKKLEAARIKVQINQLREELEDCVRSLDIDRARTLKGELQALELQQAELNVDSSTIIMEEEEVPEGEKDDPTTVSKCLSIVCEMIESPDITVMTPTLHSQHENLILPCLRSQDPLVRNQGVKALGLLSLLSKELAHQHLLLFMQISRIDIDQIQVSALRCAIDILHLYGIEEFSSAAGDMGDQAGLADSSMHEDHDQESEEAGIIISVLCQLLDHEYDEMRTLAAEGLCKLLLASRISSAKLLSKLVLMWYNPATGDDSLLRHMLGVFFPLYASFGGSNQEALCAAVMPTLKVLFDAPGRSPLADVDVEDVASFLISITSPAIINESVKDAANVHDTLVFTICTEIIAFPDTHWTKTLIRCLNKLSVSATNFSNLKQIQVLLSKIYTRVQDRVCVNLLDKFRNTIETYLKDAPEPTAEEEIKAEDEPIGPPGTPKCASPTNSAVDFKDPPGSAASCRRKRALHTTVAEMFTSDADSDYDPNCTPKSKRHGNADCNLSPGRSLSTPNKGLSKKLLIADSDSPNPLREESKEKLPKITVITTSDAEIELTKTDDSSEEDTLVKIEPQSPANESRRRSNSKEFSKDSTSPKKLKRSEDSSKSPRGRRRSQPPSTTSDDETSPSKVSRRSRSATTSKTSKSKQGGRKAVSDEVNEEDIEASEEETTPMPKVRGKRSVESTSQETSVKRSGRKNVVETPDSSSQDETSIGKRGGKASASKTSKYPRRVRKTASDNVSEEDIEVSEEETIPTPTTRGKKNVEPSIQETTPVKRSGRKKVAESPEESETSEEETFQNPRTRGKKSIEPSIQETTPVKRSGRKKVAETPEESEASEEEIISNPRTRGKKSIEPSIQETTPVKRSGRKKVAESPEESEASEEETIPNPRTRGKKSIEPSIQETTPVKRSGRKKVAETPEESEDSEEETQPKTRGKNIAESSGQETSPVKRSGRKKVEESPNSSSQEKNEAKATRNKRKSKVDMKACVNLGKLVMEQSTDEEENKQVKKKGRGRPKREENDSVISSSYPSTTLSVGDADESEDSTVPSSQEKPRRGRKPKKTVDEPEVDTLKVRGRAGRGSQSSHSSQSSTTQERPKRGSARSKK
ncbi:unnamed protein product [Meganyctiphanes norvegica]|uniref:Nuclear condensin complex subunit 3 C-terminal domain-containing protein n=1 Tax=Meganyctiphanes norvegica TaxID=48144 RepID=A0AAV2Q0N5_MEGNR